MASIPQFGDTLDPENFPNGSARCSNGSEIQCDSQLAENLNAQLLEPMKSLSLDRENDSTNVPASLLSENVNTDDENSMVDDESMENEGLVEDDESRDSQESSDDEISVGDEVNLEDDSDPEDIFSTIQSIPDTPVSQQTFDNIKFASQCSLRFGSKPPNNPQPGMAASPTPFGHSYILLGLVHTSESESPIGPFLDGDDSYDTYSSAVKNILQVIFFRYLGVRTWMLRSLLPPTHIDNPIGNPRDPQQKIVMYQAQSSFITDGMQKISFLIAEKIATGQLDSVYDDREGRMRVWNSFSSDEVLYCWKHLEPGVAIGALTSDSYPIWTDWLRRVTKWVAEIAYTRHFVGRARGISGDDADAIARLFYEDDFSGFPESLETIPSVGVLLRPTRAEVPEVPEAPEAPGVAEAEISG